MAGAKSGKAPGTSFAPGGSEVFSGEGRDYFTDPLFHRDTSIAQSSQQAKDVERLDKIKKGSSTVPSFCKGGKVIKSWSK
jgi:hypothetical protein